MDGGLNTYSYANFNPLSFIDPLGLRALSCTDCLKEFVKACGNDLGCGCLVGTLIYFNIGDILLNDIITENPGITDTGCSDSSANDSSCSDNDGDGSNCKKEQSALNSMKAVIIEFADPDQKLAYNKAVKKFNKKVAAHNLKCPNNKVIPLSPWFE